MVTTAEGAYTTTHPKLRARVTAGVCALKPALTKALPGSVLYWTVDTGNYFDYGEMITKQCVDMFLDMDYCLCKPDSRANAPLARVNRTAEIFKGYGVPPEKLGIVFPWFGCDFVCDPAGGDSCKNVVAKPQSERILPGDSNNGNTPHGGDGCGVGVDAGPGIGEVYQLLPNATQPVQLSVVPDFTKHFTWKNGSGGLHEVWYDDAQTMAVKMAAAKQIGLRGVGMWTSDATMWNASLAKEMWAAVPTPAKA